MDASFRHSSPNGMLWRTSGKCDYTAYRTQKDRARDACDKVLEAIFFYVARDEAAHGGFYRALVELELAQDREGTIADLAHVLTHFKMPGDGLIPNYRAQLNTSGAGISRGPSSNA